MTTKRNQPGQLYPEKVRYIIVHCTATPEGRDVSARDVDAWHRARGFASIGYHYLVRLDGTVERGRAENRIGAHCIGKNSCSIGVCYVGGVARDGHTPRDTRTPAQRAALSKLLTELRRRYPNAEIRGHRDFAAKACPSFDATTEYRTLGVIALAGATLTSCSTRRETTTAAKADIETTRRAEVNLDALRTLNDSLDIRMYRPKLEVDTTARFVADSVVMRRVERRTETSKAIVESVDTTSIRTNAVTEEKTSATPPGANSLPVLAAIVVIAAVCLILRKITR